ncbi:TON1 Recruiting Motif 4, LONGIFOLIA 3 [Hibiscus trionum]|uniref:TON1 Recruiting Motif 4, LONGIFOLIA 3 n=1 Tax=Hibiscus trionum TaxID=183268 RepID=A0A9W7GYT0_HIBTR|nr:TON1 Recruiting Motif 4, LONGIFOLIA 3 [Hibiscus trionum]
MSAKLVYSDGNPDLQKQIGCINGLFHHFLGSPRVATSNHKRFLPGSNGKHETEAMNASQKGNNLKKAVKEKQRLSSESPRTSFSESTCSSSYSSADCANASRADRCRSSSSQTGFREIPKQGISNDQSPVSLQSSQHSVDLRNVVKDCIYRESRGLSVKTAMKADAGQHQILKYIDSPRPLQSLKPAMTRNTGFGKLSHDFSKLREVPRMADGRKDVSLAFVPRDARRFSYDERRSHDGVKVKIKDQPRFSLDSREISIKGSTNNMKSKFLPGELNARGQQQEPGSCKGPSSVVAKLMGLETLPDPMLINENQCFRIKTNQDLKDENKRNQVSCYPRNSTKEPSSPRLTNADSRKPVATTCPNEPAPWKHMDGSSDQTSALNCSRETPPIAQNASLSVYGEIEKRLAELEFQKSGKDLRALKQILEAMQRSKQMIETRKDDQASNFASHTNSILGQSSEAPNLRKIQHSNTVSAIVKGTSSPTHLKSPIKIIKSAKCMDNASNSSSSAVATGSLSRIRTNSPAEAGNEKVDKQLYKELTLRPNSPKDPYSRLQSRDKTTSRTLRFNQTSKELPPIAQKNPKLAMSSETTCLELQQKKLESEKQPHRTCPASDQSRSRRQSIRLQTEPGLTHWKSRHKPHNPQRDASSMQLKSNMSAATYDIEVTSTDRSYKIERPVSPKQEKYHKNSTTELPSAVMEQPSPVSVLDATFYGDESPSPVKKKSNAFKDYEGLIADEADLNNKQLIFESVNEILGRMKESSHKPWVSPSMQEERKPKRQQVVGYLCSEIDKLQTPSIISLDDKADSVQSIISRDLTIGSSDWTECKSEIPGVVLDVERLIFKDLICEVISGEAANPQG